MAELIDRQAAKKAVLNVIPTKDGYLEADEVIDAIYALPFEERKKGEWITLIEHDDCFIECQCSECGVVVYFDYGYEKYNYCPNCGAEIQKENNNG